jgi:hypothetical protein
MVKVLRDFDGEYAEQAEADYGAFVAAIKSGKIKVVEEPSQDSQVRLK